MFMVVGSENHYNFKAYTIVIIWSETERVSKNGSQTETEREMERKMASQAGNSEI